MASGLGKAPVRKRRSRCSERACSPRWNRVTNRRMTRSRARTIAARAVGAATATINRSPNETRDTTLMMDRRRAWSVPPSVVSAYLPAFLRRCAPPVPPASRDKRARASLVRFHGILCDIERHLVPAHLPMLEDRGFLRAIPLRSRLIDHSSIGIAEMVEMVVRFMSLGESRASVNFTTAWKIGKGKLERRA